MDSVNYWCDVWHLEQHKHLNDILYGELWSSGGNVVNKFDIRLTIRLSARQLIKIPIMLMIHNILLGDIRETSRFAYIRMNLRFNYMKQGK